MKTLHHDGGMSKHAASYPSTLPPIRDLVASVDLSALVEKYAGPGKRNGSRGNLFQCPHPSHPDSSPSFSVFTGQDGVQRCHCLSQCGHIGDALAFVKWVRTCSTKEAADELRGFTGVASPRVFTPASKPRQLRATKPSGLVDDAKALSDYLASRSWPEEVAKTFGLQIMRDEFGTKRVRHPFYAWIDGTLTEAGWQARRLDNSQELRWLGAKDTPLPIYNLPALEADEITHAVICEGPADTITAALACSTLPGWACVGVAGAQSWRDEWAELFAGLSVIIATDNDAAGEKLSARITASLGGVASLIVAACPTANDLGDMAKAQSIEAVRELLTGWHVEEKHAIGSDKSEEENAFDALVRQLTQAFTRCKVCMHEAEQGARFCKSCARTEEVSGRPWRVCDTCNTFGLFERGRKCSVSYKCTGTFVDALAVVEAVAS